MTIFKDLDLIAAQLNKYKRSAEHIFARTHNQGVKAACDVDHGLTCSAIEALERVRASVGSELATRLRVVEEDLQAFKAAHALASGEPAEVLNTAEQDARSWALIEKWHVKCVADSGLLNVEFIGPFDYESDHEKHRIFYVRLPNGHTASGRTRSDALAHAAKGQL